jgi:hypothetical protein
VVVSTGVSSVGVSVVVARSNGFVPSPTQPAINSGSAKMCRMRIMGAEPLQQVWAKVTLGVEKVNAAYWGFPDF